MLYLSTVVQGVGIEVPLDDSFAQVSEYSPCPTHLEGIDEDKQRETRKQQFNSLLRRVTYLIIHLQFPLDACDDDKGEKKLEKRRAQCYIHKMEKNFVVTNSRNDVKKEKTPYGDEQPA